MWSRCRRREGGYSSKVFESECMFNQNLKQTRFCLSWCVYSNVTICLGSLQISDQQACLFSIQSEADGFSANITTWVHKIPEDKFSVVSWKIVSRHKGVPESTTIWASNLQWNLWIWPRNPQFKAELPGEEKSRRSVLCESRWSSCSTFKKQRCLFNAWQRKDLAAALTLRPLRRFHCPAEKTRLTFVCSAACTLTKTQHMWRATVNIFYNEWKESVSRLLSLFESSISDRMRFNIQSIQTMCVAPHFQKHK